METVTQKYGEAETRAQVNGKEVQALQNQLADFTKMLETKGPDERFEIVIISSTFHDY